MIGVDETQPGCSQWKESLNHVVVEGQMELGTLTGVVAESSAKSDDGNEIDGGMEFRVTIGGDDIEIKLRSQNVHQAQESQERVGTKLLKKVTALFGRNNDEQWNKKDDQESNSGVLDTMFTCLYSTPSHYHHCANLSEGIVLIKCLSDIFCRVCE